jgi:hypothetical protein
MFLVSFFFLLAWSHSHSNFFLLTPTHLVSSGKDIMHKLLDKAEEKRLGSQSGASQVKQHKWFAKLSWGLLRHMTPPVRFTML